MNFKKIKTLTK